MPDALIQILAISSAVFLTFSLAMLFWYTLHRIRVGRWQMELATSSQPESITHYCPGPSSTWWLTRLLPYRWFTRHACWYDLSRQVPNDEGVIRCPECGHESSRERHLHATQVFLRGRTSLILLVFAVGCMTTVIIEGEGYVKFTPTYALVAFERMGDRVQTDAMRGELRSRLWNGDVTGRSARLLAGELVENLRDDDVKRNAHEAVRGLVALRDASLPVIARALVSDDWQQRQLAFIAFQSIDRSIGYSLPVTPDLIAVALEALCDDDLKDWRNAIIAYRFLMRVLDDPEVQFHVRKALRSPADPQQRIVCALLCAYGQIQGSLPDSFPILVECLADNDISGDANHAAPALYAYGADVIPWLREARRKTTDRQATLIIDLILFDLGEPTEYQERSEITQHLPWRLGYPFAEYDQKSALDYGDSYWIDSYAWGHREDQ